MAHPMYPPSMLDSSTCGQWSCYRCTFINHTKDGRCKLCNAWKSEPEKTATRAKSKNAPKPNRATTAASAPTSTPTTSKKHKYRQAAESSRGEVEILCYTCRRNPSRKVQKTVSSFFASDLPKSKSESDPDADLPCCSKCRQPLVRPVRSPSSIPRALSKCPHIKRLEAYKKIASDNALPFDIADSAAIRIMREPCSLCGEGPGADGNGLTRLRTWPARHEAARNGKNKQVMGPFCVENLASACGTCNLMKGARIPRGYVELCRHIATYRTDGSFGLYPDRFRDNISRRSRSSYITRSSTHTKTHSLTNAAFSRITKMPCHFCGKASRPDTVPPHHNGLDRLDNTARLYSEETVVSCCGDCNVCKYTHSEKFFLDHVVKVASFHRDTNFEELPEI